MNYSKESGSHLIVVAVFLAVVGAIGFAGYRMYQLQQPSLTDTTHAASTTAAPAKITNTASLNQAAAALDNSSAAVNSNLDDSALNADLNSML